MGSPEPLVELDGRPLISYPLAAIEAASLEPPTSIPLGTSDLGQQQCHQGDAVN
jgi:hypothetical protein